MLDHEFFDARIILSGGRHFTYNLLRLSCGLLPINILIFNDNFDRFIEPTILLDPPLDAEIMTEEIFGPILPIITVTNNILNSLYLQNPF